MEVPRSRAGTRFGQYEVRSLLGRGGMGEVYEAFDTGKDRVVALKVLPEQYAQDPSYQERFRRESQAAAALTEPHIVPIHDWGEIDGALYIDMRLVRGENLRTLLRRQGPLDSERTLAIIGQVAAALDAAHAAGVVHRDVKPANILVTPADFAYLADFGIARNDGDIAVTSVGTAIGSYSYMAPERFQVGPANARSDIYSLGCVLHECLTGSVPFAAQNVHNLIRAHMSEPPPRPSAQRSSVPESVDPVIARALAKSPDQRYASAGEFAEAARSALTSPRREPAEDVNAGVPADATTTAFFGAELLADHPRGGKGSAAGKDHAEDAEPATAHAFGTPAAGGSDTSGRTDSGNAGSGKGAAAALGAVAGAAAVGAAAASHGGDSHGDGDDATPVDEQSSAFAASDYRRRPDPTTFQPFGPTGPTIAAQFQPRPVAPATGEYPVVAGRDEKSAAESPESTDDEPAATAQADPDEPAGPTTTGTLRIIPPSDEGRPDASGDLPVIRPSDPTRVQPHEFGYSAEDAAAAAELPSLPKRKPQVPPGLPDLPARQPQSPPARPTTTPAALMPGFALKKPRPPASSMPFPAPVPDSDPAPAEDSVQAATPDPQAFVDDPTPADAGGDTQLLGVAGGSAPDATETVDAGNATETTQVIDPIGEPADYDGEYGYGSGEYSSADYEEYADYDGEYPSDEYDADEYGSGEYDPDQVHAQGLVGESDSAASGSTLTKSRSVAVPVVLGFLGAAVLVGICVVAWKVLGGSPPPDRSAAATGAPVAPVSAAPTTSAAPSTETSTTSATTTSGSAADLPVGATKCSQSSSTTGTAFSSVATGSSATTCDFAQAVRKAYAQSAQSHGVTDASSATSTSVVAKSPVTGRSYTMTCTGASGRVVTCSGGDNAVVYVY